MNLFTRAKAFVTDERVRASARELWGRVGWGEFVTLGALLVLSAGLWAFVELADEMVEGETHGIDTAILTALRTSDDPSDPIGPPWVEVVFRDFTALGGYTTITAAALVAAGYLAILRQWGTIALIAGSLIGGTILNNVLKGVFGRPRPDLVAHLVEVQTLSFPSGHAMLAAVAYLTLGALLAQVQRRRRIKVYIVAVAVVLTVLIGFSRVYLGVHWPTDVLAGWAVGAAWAMAWWLAARYLVYRKVRQHVR